MPPVGSADYPAETETNDIPSLADPLALGTKGFTASIHPVGDIDVFSVDITTAGTAMTVTISDGNGGCPAGLTTAVRVDGPNGSVASEIGSCPQLSPAFNMGLANLALGKHYVQVENTSFSTSDFYVVDIATTGPVCGNGIIQGTEQCDDGNMNTGDGCLPDCKLEGTFINEVEPNQPLANANAMGNADGVCASIQPVGDRDYFSFDLTTPGSSITIETTDGLGGCPAGFDSVIYLYSPAGVEIVSDDEEGIASCSLISSVLDPEATNLPAGKYTVMVEDWQNNNAADSYVLKIKVQAPGCGDSIVQSGEQCDDGNTNAGDGCSATCQIEGNYLPEMETNDTQALANSVDGYDGAAGAISPVGDQDYFSFDVTVPGSSVRIETTNGYNGCPTGFDSELYLYGPNDQLIVSDDEGGVDSCSAITPQLYAQATNLNTGKYKVRVQDYGNNNIQASYVVKIKVLVPGCGDALLTPPEQCDDGNMTSGDGCDAMCNSESPWEIESNNTQALATPLWSGTTKFHAGINPAGDVDYFSFVLPAGTKPVLTTHDIGNVNTCAGDTQITLYDANGVSLGMDDDSGPVSCSMLSIMNNLAAGTYYVKVNEYGNDGTIPSYQLDVVFQ